MLYRLLADGVVLFHAAWVAVVVLSLPMILLGAAAGWKWVRNFWYRIVHLSMMMIVVFESWVGITCPLTTLENYFRAKGGQKTYGGDFIANFVHDALFLELPSWGFTLMYTAFGAVLLATILWIPPRWPDRLRWRVSGTTPISG